MNSRQNYKWWVVAMLWLVCVFNYADRQAIFSVFPLLKKEMGLSDVELGIVGGAFMWIYAAGSPLAGLIGDRLPRKWLILGGLIFWSIVTLGTALAQNYWQLVACRALEGFGEAFYFPASMSLISDYHSPATRSRAMSLHQSSVYAGTILGGSVAGYCADAFGWRSGFYIFGGLGVVLGIVLVFILKEPQRGEAEVKSTAPAPEPVGAESRSAGIESIVRIPMALVLIAVFVGANFVASIFLTWMPSFMNGKFHMSLTMAGINSTVWLQISSVLGVICGGVLADRLACRHTCGRMMAQAAGLLLGVPFIFLTGWTLSVPALVLALVGFGFFKGLYDANIWASLYDVVPVRARATAVGLTNAIGWFGGGIAPVAIAMASAHFGMSACLSATSVIYLGVGLILALAIRRKSCSQSIG